MNKGKINGERWRELRSEQELNFDLKIVKIESKSVEVFEKFDSICESFDDSRQDQGKGCQKATK